MILLRTAFPFLLLLLALPALILTLGAGDIARHLTNGPVLVTMNHLPLLVLFGLAIAGRMAFFFGNGISHRMSFLQWPLALAVLIPGGILCASAVVHIDPVLGLLSFLLLLQAAGGLLPPPFPQRPPS